MMTNVLDLEMGRNDAGAKTVREYLKKLLAEVWEHEECFSGKRPFGNSGWSWELYLPLVKAGIVTGTLDEHGNIEDCDDDAAKAIIAKAIEDL